MLRFLSRHYNFLTFLLGFFISIPAALFLFVQGNSFAFISAYLIFCYLFNCWFIHFFTGLVNRAFWEHCDPEPYLELSLSFIRWHSFPPLKSFRRIYFKNHMSAATAFGVLGRYQEALAYRDKVDLSFLSPQQQIVYWINRSDTLFYLNQPEEMAFALDKAQQLLDNSSVPAAQQSNYSQLIQLNRQLLHMLTDGPNQEVESVLTAYLEQAPRLCQQVVTRMHLAHCAHARGDLAAQREHLEFVVAHGNKLAVRAQAVELLASFPTF